MGHTIKIYPVPVNGLLSIEFSEFFQEDVEISVADITGKVIKSVKTRGLMNTIDMSETKSGLYIVKISGKNINVVKYISKQ